MFYVFCIFRYCVMFYQLFYNFTTFIDNQACLTFFVSTEKIQEQQYYTY